jgi:hypothetical protein
MDDGDARCVARIPTPKDSLILDNDINKTADESGLLISYPTLIVFPKG